ncbi:MAG TPA: type II secretion system F family protein [Rhodospirillales bacterium]|nr:type II secretion system F family protein [Rhodospirillales bacterium]
MNINLILLFIGAIVAFGAIGLVIGNIMSRTDKLMKQRIARVRTRVKQGNAGTNHGATGQTLKKQDKRSFLLLDTLVQKILPRREILSDRLAKTGREIAVGTYALINLIVAVAMILVAEVVLGQGIVVAVLMGIIAGLGLPYMVVGRMAEKRIKVFTAQFPDAIDLIVRGLKSGLPVTESIASVGREMPNPVGAEFRLISDSIKFGKSLEAALWETARRLDTAEFKFFVISLSVQQETGGNLSEALGNLSDILRRRRQMKMKIKAMSSEAKASAMILGSLPFVMFLIIFALNPEYEMELFTDPRGQIMLGFGVGIMTIGIAIMSKMVKFEI